MALVIISAGTLTSSRLRTLTMPVLAVVAGGVLLAGLVAGFALGFRAGGTARAAAVPNEAANLDPSHGGDQALIREIGSLSGRLNQLEATASRLSRRVGAQQPPAGTATPKPAKVSAAPAGGPLLPLEMPAGSGAGASLLRLNHALDQVEMRLERVASLVARSELDEMAFPSRSPIPGVPVSSGFGQRIDPFTQRLALHAGIDYAAPYGTSILASAGGRVRRAGPYGSFGNTVEIDHGDGLVTRYGHLSRILVRVGDPLLPGQPIARLGSTGRSTGPHLHFEILRDGRQVQPDLYLAGGRS